MECSAMLCQLVNMTASMFKLHPCNCLYGIAREGLLEVMGGGGENEINVSWLKTWTCFSEAEGE